MPRRDRRQQDFSDVHGNQSTDGTAASTSVTMTSEQLKALLEQVRVSNETAAAAMAHIQTMTAASIQTAGVPQSGNFTKCTARFDGQSGAGVEAFLDNVNTYRQCCNVSDANALLGLTMLLTGEAADWWQGHKRNVSTWAECIIAECIWTKYTTP